MDKRRKKNVRGTERDAAMLWAALLALQGVCVGAAHGMQHYPAAWGHYDVCKSQIYTEEGLAWDYMACQPEAVDMTKYLRVTIDPPNITCGAPPETYCALVSPSPLHTPPFPHIVSPFSPPPLRCPMMETDEAVGRNHTIPHTGSTMECRVCVCVCVCLCVGVCVHSVCVCVCVCM